MTAGPEWWQNARHLLAASRTRRAKQSSTSLLFPASLALINLFLCAYSENPIKEDPSGHSLSLFLLAQGLGILMLTLAHLSTTGVEILRKSLVMPVPGSARLAFAIASSARVPAIQAVVLSNVFFLLVLYHSSVATVLLVPLLGGVMAADIIVLASIAVVAAIRISRPPTIVAAWCVVGLLGVIAATLLLPLPAAPTLLPPMSWTARGITASVAGETWQAIMYGAAGTALLLASIVIGRRIA